MSTLLARVAAIAARESAKSSANREDMRAQHPELAASVDAIRAVFGEPHAITVAGTRYGKPPMPFRRDQPEQPPIVEVTGVPALSARPVDCRIVRKRGDAQ